MDPPRPTGPRVAGTRKETPWRCSGTYYLDDVTKKKSNYWRNFLLMFLFILLLSLLLTIAIFYLLQDDPEDTLLKDQFKEQCGEEIIIGATIKKYKEYENRSVRDICERYRNFVYTDEYVLTPLSSLATGNPPSVFDHTSFSDMNGTERVSYAERKLSLKEGGYNLQHTTDKKNISYFGDFSETVNFNDSRPIEEDIKSALLLYTWYNTNEEDFRKSYPNASSLLAESYNFDLALIKNLNETLKYKNDAFQKGYLANRGIFVTEIYVDDRFFFYKDGIFPAILCNQTGGKIKIAVMVLGFGTKTFDNQSYDYWLVQPIGEKFKNWGRNGVAEISDLCYKNNDTPRVIDIMTRNSNTPFAKSVVPQF